MNRRGLIILVLLSLAGYGLTARLFPKVHPAAQWNLQLDRQTAISRAREIARQLDFDASTWQAKVTSDNKRDEEFWLTKSKLASPELKKLLSPIVFDVKLIDLNSGRQLRVELTCQGEVRSINIREPRTTPAPATASLPPGQEVSQQEQLARKSRAESYLSSLFPYTQELAQTLSDASYTLNNTRMKYEGRGGSVQVEMGEGRLERIEVMPAVTMEMRAENEGRRGRWARLGGNLDNFYIWLLVLLVVAYYVIAMSLRRLQPRLTLTFWVLAVLLLFYTNLAGSFADDLRFNMTITGVQTNYWIELTVPWLIYGLVSVILGFIVYTVFAAGLAVYIWLSKRRSIGVELLLRGKVLTRPVTGGLLTGLLAGGMLSALPLLVAAGGWFSGTELHGVRESSDLAARMPALASFISPHQLVYFALFALIAPLIDLHIKARALARTVMLLVTVVLAAGVSMVYLPGKAMFAVAVLVSLCLTIIYYRFDLLAVMATILAAEATYSGLTLLVQANESLRLSGKRIFLGLGTMMLVSLVAYWRSREVSEEETAVPASLLETRAERERLKADFDVARRAQEKLLPDAPPSIPGFDIAAVCRPSKEVGGDLYDFLRFPDGRLGVVVADVSGKGVPASLYMTLTKGLLNSLIEELTDAGEILREVNIHLYEACRRKVFVTLFLGIIDPASRTMQYARAGHNPTVLHRASNREALLLKSPGMGLGLGGKKVFNTSLKVETIELGPGDSLLFYSDGITEAMNQRKEEYGEERLMALATRAGAMTAEQLRDAVMSDVGKFLGSVQPQDDQTLVVVRVG